MANTVLPNIERIETRFGPFSAAEAIILGVFALCGLSVGYVVSRVTTWGIGSIVAGIIVIIGVVVGIGKIDGIPLHKYLRLRHTYNTRSGTKVTEKLAVIDSVCIKHGNRYITGIKVSGKDISLQDERAEYYGAYEALLNSLDTDIQLISRSEKLNIMNILDKVVSVHEKTDDKLYKKCLEDYGIFLAEQCENARVRSYYVICSGTSEKRAKEALAQVMNIAGSYYRVEPLSSEALAELIKEDGIREGAETLIAGKKYVKILEVKEYPSVLSYECLDELFTIATDVDIVFHIHPLSTDHSLDIISKGMTKLEVEIMSRRNPEDAIGAKLSEMRERLEEIRNAIASKEERLFTTSFIVVIRGDSADEVKEETQRIKTMFRGAMIQVKEPKYRMRPVYEMSKAIGYKYDSENAITVNTKALSALYPFYGEPTLDENGILYGFDLTTNVPVFFNRYGLENYNTCIFGVSGSGKSYAAKLEILRYSMLDPNLRVYIIDPLGEFHALIKELGGEIVEIGKSKINPLNIGELDERAVHAMDFLSILLNLREEERYVLDSVLSRVLDTEAEVVLNTLVEELEKEKSIYAQRITHMLRQMLMGRYGFLNNISDVKLTNKKIVLDISKIDRELFPAIMYMLLSYIMSECKKYDGKKLIYVDESWYLMQHEVSAKMLANMTRHSRHYQTGLTLISQSAEDFLSSSEGRIVLTNSSMIMLFRHKKVLDDMREYWNLSDMEADFVKKARTGKEGYSTGLLVMGNRRIPIAVLSSQIEREIGRT